MGLWKERTSSTVERCVKNQVMTHFFHWTEPNHIRFNSSPVSSSAVEHLPSTRVGETSPGENIGSFKARLCGSLHRGASPGFQGFHAQFCPIIHCTDSSWILWYGLSVNHRFILKLKALYLFNIQHPILARKWLLSKRQRWKVHLPPHWPLCNMGGEFSFISYTGIHIFMYK